MLFINNFQKVSGVTAGVVAISSIRFGLKGCSEWKCEEVVGVNNNHHDD